MEEEEGCFMYYLGSYVILCNYYLYNAGEQPGNIEGFLIELKIRHFQSIFKDFQKIVNDMAFF